MNSFIVAIVIYALIGTTIAYYSRGAKTQEEYFIAGRKVSGFISAMTYAATTYSAFMMVGLVGLAYKTGVGAAGFELMYLVGTLFLLSYYGPKIWKISREYGIVSPAEFLKIRYGSATAKLAAVVSLVALIPYTSVQLIGVALILENAGITYIHGIAVAAFLIALWAYMGGLRGVALTDAVQGVVMLASALLALTFVTAKTDISQVSRLGELLYVPNSIWTYTRFAALVTPWFFFALTNPQVFQRIFIPRDEDALKKMVVYFGLFGLIYTFLVTLLGIELRVMTETGNFPMVEDRDKVTPTLLAIMPDWLALLVAISILAAAITTANSIVLSLSSMLSRDVFRERYVLLGRISVIVLTLAVAVFASLRIEYIVELAVLSSTILLCLLPLILGFFHWDRGGEVTGVATVLTGFAAAISLWWLKASLFGIPNSVLTLAVTVLAYLVFSTVERRKQF